MSHRTPFLVVFIAVMLVPAGATQNAAQPVTGAQSTVHIFDYDSKQPLDIVDKVVEETPDAVIHDITYASPKGGRVPAYLVVPKAKGPFAAVLFGHYGLGLRSEFIRKPSSMLRQAQFL
jgi:hypothetical protein